MSDSISFIVDFLIALIGFLRANFLTYWKQWAAGTILLLGFAYLADKFLRIKVINPSYRHFKALVSEPRAVCGAFIAAIGTFIIFSPSLSYWENWYSQRIEFYRNSLIGLSTLSVFEFEPSEPDLRQRVKTLKKGQDGFDEMLRQLEKLNAEGVAGRSVSEITNRRQYKYEENSGQYLDMMNVIHIYDENYTPPFSLVTTEDSVRQSLESEKNRIITGAGTAIAALGIFWQYVWQLATYSASRIETTIIEFVRFIMQAISSLISILMQIATALFLRVKRLSEMLKSFKIKKK